MHYKWVMITNEHHNQSIFMIKLFNSTSLLEITSGKLNGGALKPNGMFVVGVRAILVTFT